MEKTAVRALTGVVVAGIVGTIANTAALVAVLGSERLSLGLVPGRYAVAILLCAALPLLDRWLRGASFWAAAIVWLTVAPSLLAKLVFGAAAGWSAVLGFNLVYALAALATYWLIAGLRREAVRD